MNKKNIIFSLKNLPKNGLCAFVGFAKRAAIEADYLIRDLLTKSRSSKQDVEAAAKYAIAKQFVEMFEERYNKKFIREFVSFFGSPQMIDFVNDHVILETQKILTSDEERDIIKRRDRADGIMVIPKLAEKIEIYRMTVKQYESKHPEVEQMIDEGEERFGEQEMED